MFLDFVGPRGHGRVSEPGDGPPCQSCFGFADVSVRHWPEGLTPNVALDRGGSLASRVGHVAVVEDAEHAAEIGKSKWRSCW